MFLSRSLTNSTTSSRRLGASHTHGLLSLQNTENTTNLLLNRGGSALGQEPSESLAPPPQNQKLADRSDVISEVPKCSKIQISGGSASDHAGGAYSAPPEPLADGRGSLTAPCQEPHPTYGSQGLTNWRENPRAAEYCWT